MSSIFHCLVACTVEVQSVKMLSPVSCPISDHYFDLLSKKYAVNKLFFLQASKRARSRFLKDTNYDPESNDARNILSRCRLKLRDFLQIIYQMVPDP